MQNPDVANRAKSYRAGWIHGASIKGQDARFTAHANSGICEEYGRGYADGYMARKQAISQAYERLGYVPNILRLAGDSEEVGGGG